MSKAEDYIKENTKNNANISISYNTGEGISSHSQPWLTPDQARKAVEIAREEIYEWLLANAHNYCLLTNNFEARRCIYDLKQTMKDE